MKTVKITGYLKRFRKEDQTPFFVFSLFGGPIARVSSTGKMSLSTPVVTIPANTLDENILKACVGMELSGSIVAEECAPTEFTNAQGIKGIRRHNWVFKPTVEDVQSAPLAVSTPEVAMTTESEDLQ